MKCNLCNGARYVVQRTHDYAAVTACNTCTCEICNGEGFEFERSQSGHMMSRPCRICDPARHRRGCYNSARIPARYVNATLQNYTPATNSQREALDWLVSRVSDWSPTNKSLLLSGTVGTGKTHLLTAFIRELTLERGIPARFIEFSHLLSDIRGGYDAGHSDSKIIAPLVNVPVLVIDELGKSLKTEWQQGILDALISRRYERGLATFATTNYPVELHLGRAVRGTDEFNRRTLSEVVGERISSRLAELCDTIELSGPDHRLQNHKRVGGRA